MIVLILFRKQGQLFQVTVGTISDRFLLQLTLP
jgi:hypothetical protein